MTHFYVIKEKIDMYKEKEYEFSRNDVYRVGCIMRTFNADEFAILQYLVEKGSGEWIDITHSKLSRELDRYVSNVRKAVYKLEKRGVVSICGRPMKSIYLNPNWSENLLMGEYL